MANTGEYLTYRVKIFVLDYGIDIKGQIKQVKSFLTNMTLQRTIRSYAGKNKIIIDDVVENKGTTKEPLMLLYHFNFGFPLLNEDSGLIIPNINQMMGKAGKEYDVTGYDQFRKPEVNGGEELKFFETLVDERGYSRVILTNNRENPELALLMKYNRASLPKLVLWKYLNSRNYVLGVEPANCHIQGRTDEYNHETLEYLEPLAKKEIHLEIEVLDQQAEILKIIP
jgi:hypothetical protein